MKVVKIQENKLVDLIENIVNERVSAEKKQWLSEQKTKGEALLENKVKKLEKIVSELIKK